MAITQPLKEEIAALKRELSSVKEHANQNEQNSRRSNIRIFGIDETTDEICHDVVKEFFSNDLGVELTREKSTVCTELAVVEQMAPLALSL